MGRSIEQLVNQQVLRWTESQRREEQLQRREAQSRRGEAWAAGATRQQAARAAAPSICISREFGTYAGDLAREVAAQIGFDVYDQELVDAIARQAHVRRKVVQSLDERVQHGLSAWVDELMVLQSFTPSDYLRNLSQVVLTLGRHGRAVMIGRGAHLILDPAQTLRVRCYAPREWRIEQVAKREGLSAANARALTERIDAERTQFYKDHFQADFYDPSHFDLLLNASTSSVQARADLIAQALDAKFAPASMPPQSGVRHRLAGSSEETESFAVG